MKCKKWMHSEEYVTVRLGIYPSAFLIFETSLLYFMKTY